MTMNLEDKILFELGRLNATQERILETFRGHFEDDKENFGKVNDKIRTIEAKMNYATGVIAVMIVIATAVWNWILKKVGA